MPLQFSTTLRNNRIGQVETTMGTSPVLEIRTGPPPASPSDADTGTLLVSITLPSDWLSDPNNGQVTKLGTWQATAVASGTAGHFRIKAGTTTHIQGTVTVTGGGGDLELDNTSINSGQTVTITSFTLTEGNA